MKAVHSCKRRARSFRFPSPGEVIIAPSLLAADFAQLKQELRRISRARCDWVHLDIMDGHFVPNLTIGPCVVESLCRAMPHMFFDAHLMVECPELYVSPFARSGVQLLTIHQECCPEIGRVIRAIKKEGLKVGVSIKPRTALARVEPVLDQIDLVLIMTVEPGFGGQSLIPSALNKVRRLNLLRKAEGHRFLIQVDGGIDQSTAPLVVAAGAEVLVAGTAVFGNGRVAENIQALRSSIATRLST
jgi:ribulose-phosphate 3-epimerase